MEESGAKRKAESGKSFKDEKLRTEEIKGKNGGAARERSAVQKANAES